MSLTRRDALKTLGALAAARLDPKTLSTLQQRTAPNIVFIMTDDQRHDALSSAGNTILRTPNIDRLGSEGIRFTEAFVTNALCAPSRASVLTGLYSHTHGVITNGGGPQYYNQPGLRGNQTTFVDLLRSAGYYTALLGKWHLRSEPRGFDRWVVFPGQGAYHDPEMIANGVREYHVQGMRAFQRASVECAMNAAARPAEVDGYKDTEAVKGILKLLQKIKQYGSAEMSTEQILELDDEITETVGESWPGWSWYERARA